ncbi:hypothetical protein HGRIS_010743 [Hohenbuehelia grisea]|uniref:Uncharacterized protein n=1 Tax=Hohenbuehelia grisea TaxID=104357 RepID=A0ABR3IXU1_9AGAR
MSHSTAGSRDSAALPEVSRSPSPDHRSTSPDYNLQGASKVSGGVARGKTARISVGIWTHRNRFTPLADAPPEGTVFLFGVATPLRSHRGRWRLQRTLNQFWQLCVMTIHPLNVTIFAFIAASKDSAYWKPFDNDEGKLQLRILAELSSAQPDGSISASRPTHHARSASASGIPTTTSSASDTSMRQLTRKTPEYIAAVAHALGVSACSNERGYNDPQAAYREWQHVNDLLRKASQMSKDNYDFRPIPNKQDITELVVSKGTMANWDRTFKDLAWPDMIAWLSGSQDAPPQSDVLGLARPTLSLVRTKAVEWTAQQKALEVVERQKQEKKAKGSKKGKDDAAGSSKKGKGKSGT